MLYPLILGDGFSRSISTEPSDDPDYRYAFVLDRHGILARIRSATRLDVSDPQRRAEAVSDKDLHYAGWSSRYT